MKYDNDSMEMEGNIDINKSIKNVVSFKTLFLPGDRFNFSKL